MEIITAIEILEYHQKWRLGKRDDMIHEPKIITQALDMVINAIKESPTDKKTNGRCPSCGQRRRQGVCDVCACKGLEAYGKFGMD
mgnify:FL=1